MDSILNGILPTRHMEHLLRPFHTLKASLVAYAVTLNVISDTVFLDLTVPLLVEVMQGSHLEAMEAVIVYVGEKVLDDEFQRIFEVYGDIRDMEVVFCNGHIFLERGPYHFSDDATSMLRLLKARGGVDKIVVHLEMH